MGRARKIWGAYTDLEKADSSDSRTGVQELQKDIPENRNLINKLLRYLHN